MALSIPVVWAEAHRLHAPEQAIWLGAPISTDELPARADAIRAELERAGAPVVPAQPHPDDALLAVHSEEFVSFLRTARSEWTAEGYERESGQENVVGYLFPTAGFVAGVEPREPRALSARVGTYAYDTMTVVAEGTWEAARAAVDAALTASDLVLAGARTAYACCRPPGHHVTRTAFGGSCYLNNAAVAAQHLRTRGVARVAVLDIDAHHGNGTQAIYWERDDVFTGSVHVDPGAGWFPHYLGFADERGEGPAETNLNVPLAPGTGDEQWLDGIAFISDEAASNGSDALVVALGVDAATDDPNSPLEVTEAGFREAGRLLAMRDVSTVFVQEGGYVLGTVGPLVRAVLEGFEEVAGS